MTIATAMQRAMMVVDSAIAEREREGGREGGREGRKREREKEGERGGGKRGRERERREREGGKRREGWLW